MEEQPQVEEQKNEAPKEPKAPPPPIELDSKKLLAPKNHAENNAIIKWVFDGGGFPKIFDTPEKRFAAQNLGRALCGERWQLAVNNMCYIKDKLCIWGEFPGTIAEWTGEVQEKYVYLINDRYERICEDNKNLTDTAFAAICKIQRKGRTLKEYSFTLKEAEDLGLYPAIKNIWKDKQIVGKELSPDSPWNKCTGTMLWRRALQKALKIEFPESFIGVAMAEYDHGIAPDHEPNMKDVTPSVDKTKKLNEKFSSSSGPRAGEERVAPPVEFIQQ